MKIRRVRAVVAALAAGQNPQYQKAAVGPVVALVVLSPNHLKPPDLPWEAAVARPAAPFAHPAGPHGAVVAERVSFGRTK